MAITSMGENGNGDDGDRKAPDEAIIQLNPEVMSGVPILPGLDEIKVVFLQTPRPVARVTEGVVIHVVGTGLVAALVLFVGLFITDVGVKGSGSMQSCLVESAPRTAE